MRNLRWLALLMFVLASLLVAACGDDDDDDDGGGNGGAATSEEAASGIQRNEENSSTRITVGSKNFTEQKILGEVYAQALEAAGYTVQKELNLGDEQTALKALETSEIDAYPEYTGTILQAFFGVKSEDVPLDEQEAYEEASDRLASEKQLTTFPPTPYTNSNEVAVTQETADRLSLSKISDLEGEAGSLTLYGTPECRRRLDCLLGLQQVYGLDFEKFVPVDINLRHEVLSRGQADVSIVFTTDPQIFEEGFVLLEDDKNMFPPFNTTFMVRDEVVEQAGPDLETVVGQVSEELTDEVMQELNARVDLDKEAPEQVATDFLSETGLVQ